MDVLVLVAGCTPAVRVGSCCCWSFMAFQSRSRSESVGSIVSLDASVVHLEGTVTVTAEKTNQISITLVLALCLSLCLVFSMISLKLSPFISVHLGRASS